MIEVEHLQKNFVKTVKEPGLKGLCAPLFILKTDFEAVKDLTFEVPRGQILGFIRGKWCWEVDDHQNANRDFETDIWFVSD